MGLLPIPSTHSGEPRRHSDVSVVSSRHYEGDRRHSDVSERPSKVPRFGDGELAGKEAELQFPEVQQCQSLLLSQARHLLGVCGCRRNVGGSNQMEECL